MGPFKVGKTDFKRKLVWILEHSDRPFNIAQVKRYDPPDKCPDTFITSLQKTFERYLSPDDSAFIYLTEVLHPTDQRASCPEMTEAKKSEIRNFLRRNTFKIILKKDVPPNGNILSGRFVLAIKSTVDGQIKFKARFVIGGHRDKMKNMMVHCTITAQPQTVRMVMSIASILDFNAWGSDVRQAYLQSTKGLDRQLYIMDAVPEFELNPDECLLLLRPLYGLCDSGDLRFETMDGHFQQELKLTKARLDTALYALDPVKSLKGLVATYVDDLLHVGKSEMRKVCEESQKKIDMDREQEPPIQFTGQYIRKKHNGYTIDKKPYIEKNHFQF